MSLSLKSRLFATVFVCGFVVMAFEIIGSRVLAPYMGASVLVWTSIIGVVLLAMSGGYWVGGLLADRGAQAMRLARFILLAAATICLINLVKEKLLTALAAQPWPLLLKSTLGALALFSAPAFCLAAVFPYALRLALHRIEESGRTAGRFYALSTLGSIMGTFLSATVLIPAFGTSTIIWILAALLLTTALLLFWSKTTFREGLSAIALVFASGSQIFTQNLGFIDTDTSYNRVWIYEGHIGNRTTRHMALNGHVNSGMFTDDPIVEQVYAYSGYFRLAEYFKPDFENALMLGAGAYSFPKLFQHLWPERRLCVVEIDAGLTALGIEHFAFAPSENTRLAHEDARIFLQQSDERFDVIFNDVFTSPLDVPFQMCTQECYRQMYECLADDGVLIVNVLGAWQGEHSAFLKSQVKTAQAVFAEVRVVEVAESSPGAVKNNMLIALKKKAQQQQSEEPALHAMLKNERFPVIDECVLLMTDEYAPSDWLLARQ